MPWRGSKEKAFTDGKIFVIKGKGEVAAFASGGLVRFIEHRKVKALTRLQCFANNAACGLVGGENQLHAGKGRVQKTAHARGVGCDFKVEVGLLCFEHVESFLHTPVGADAEVGKAGQAGFAQPYVQGLAQQGQRGQQNQNALGL